MAESAPPLKPRSLLIHGLGLLCGRGRASGWEFAAVAGLGLAGVAALWLARSRVSSIEAGVAAGLLALIWFSNAARRLQDANVSRRGVLKYAALASLALAAILLLLVLFDRGPATLEAILTAITVASLLPSLGTVLLLPWLIPAPGANRHGPPPPWTPAKSLAPRSPPPLGREASIIRWRMKKMQQAALWLELSPEPGFTKLGGLPALEAGFPWPIDGNGQPLAFVAQIDLAQARAAGGPDWLPDQGLLCLFIQPDGWDPQQGWTAVIRDGPAADPLRAAPPKAKTFGERIVAMRSQPSWPSLDWLGLDPRELDLEDDELDALADFPGQLVGPDEIQHRIGGYPAELQDEPLALLCELGAAADRRAPYKAFPDAESLKKAQLSAARKWRLLLQVDSDPDLGMNWGDGGRLFVFVRAKDARAGDFSKVWIEMQMA